MDHADHLEVGIRAAHSAGQVLADWRRRFTVREKGRADLVTEADVAAQSAIYSVIHDAFPNQRFLGEEGPASAPPTVDSLPTWIVDPIDGTTNYVHDVPCYAISIALMMHGELVLGVVYDPVRDEMFHATQGGGAYLGKTPIRASKVQQLSQSLLTVGFPPDPIGHEIQLERWKRLSLGPHGLRRTGSTAINLAYVAAGRFDGFFADGLKVWDVAGGVVLVREAGGLVTHFDAASYDPFRPQILATNGFIHEEVRTACIDAAKVRAK